MTYIKNLHLIRELLSPEDLASLEAEAAEYFQTQKIEYKILEVDLRNVTIRITQIAASKEEFLSSKQMADIGKKLFRRFLSHMNIHTRPLAQVPPKTEKVNAGWVNYMLAAKGITLETVLEETGINRKKVHDWLSGREPMPPEVKAMFWYMLR
jgi:hypothetical protein